MIFCTTQYTYRQTTSVLALCLRDSYQDAQESITSTTNVKRTSTKLQKSTPAMLTNINWVHWLYCNKHKIILPSSRTTRWQYDVPINKEHGNIWIYENRPMMMQVAQLEQCIFTHKNGRFYVTTYLTYTSVMATTIDIMTQSTHVLWKLPHSNLQQMARSSRMRYPVPPSVIKIDASQVIQATDEGFQHTKNMTATICCQQPDLSYCLFYTVTEDCFKGTVETTFNCIDKKNS